ncbi:MAG: endonuclease/exonuclease/phosphatase family protein [Acidobacteriota bacterium]|nr:endonuclease/exonuclease/phosphatase family protein [Acidobacteriota bacterium]
MQAVSETNGVSSPAILEHNLKPYFSDLAQFGSTKALEKSTIFQKLKPDIEGILNSIVGENFALPVFEKRKTVRVLAWNIERGKELDGIIAALENHEDLNDRDLLLLTELDYGMARSGNRFVAREIATALKMNYVFAPCYLALNKGNGVEADMEGENEHAIHGLAVFSRFPIRRAHVVRFPNGKDKMHGAEKRIGCLRGLVAEIEHPTGNFYAVTVHLDAHSSRAHRVRQMRILLEYINQLQPKLPVIIGGDWNTTTHNAQNSTRAILGYVRRVLMGARNVTQNHYPHPERFFERELFQTLERFGFEYKRINSLGEGTLHYEVNSLSKNQMLADLIPDWCFAWIFWAMESVGDSFSLRLDWFAGRDIEPAKDFVPKVVGNLIQPNGIPLSDHDAIVLDFTVSS